MPADIVAVTNIGTACTGNVGATIDQQFPQHTKEKINLHHSLFKGNLTYKFRLWKHDLIFPSLSFAYETLGLSLISAASQLWEYSWY